MGEPIRPAVVGLVGNRIRSLRLSAGLTVVKLAERSNVSRRMLTQIELGQANPSIATVDRIASALGTTFPALVGLVSEPSSDGVEVWSTPNGSWAYLLKAIETSDVSVEMWKWRLVEGDGHPTAPPAGSPNSMVHVLKGQLRVRSSAIDLHVAEGESASIVSSSGYTFEAASEAADFLWVVTISRVEAEISWTSDIQPQ